MTDHMHYVTTAAIMQGIRDRRTAASQQRWATSMGRCTRLESVPPVFARKADPARPASEPAVDEAVAPPISVVE